VPRVLRREGYKGLLHRVFFFLSLSPFTLLDLSGTFTVGLFFVIFPVMRRGSGVLSPATHADPLSSTFSGRHNTNTTTHNIHGRPIRPGIRTLLTSRWCRKSVALPSTTLPSAPDRHTHTSMAWRRFLPSKKSSPFGGIRTHYRRDRDLGALSPTAMRPPSYLNNY
jgi:hypothetical protein